MSSVIPAMDAIDHAFTMASIDGDHFSLPIKITLKLGKHIMNKYYNLTDESEIYRVSIGMLSVLSVRICLTLVIVLHPSLKLQYFKNNKWLQNWQADAIAITRRIFNNEYTSSSLPDNTGSSVSALATLQSDKIS
jgi:hypothetical protein